MHKKIQNFKDRQRGAVLMISLIMLTVLTLIGLSSARISGLEILMGVNTQSSVDSLLIAEDSVFAGEQRVLVEFGGAPTIDFTANDEDGLYLDANLIIDTVDWSELASELEPRAGEPSREYIVEYIGPRIIPGGSLGVGTGALDNSRFVYRISGHGGASRGSARVVQTIFALRGS